MHLMYFTEQPMSAYDADEGRRYGATALTFSNRNFDPVAGSRLYNQYLEDYIYADECGAPEKFTGCKLIPTPTEDGKLTVKAVRHA